MAIYNIPGITTSVIDNTYNNTTTSSGRCVLIAGFSKYGEEDIYEFNDAEKVEQVLGTANYKKYGLALKYIKGALTRTNKVLYKRLLSDDATFANVGVNQNLEILSVPDIIDINTLSQTDNVLTFPAKARGNGYNSLYIDFSPAYNLESLYANDEGDLDYRFNFLKADIYEQSTNGLVSVSQPIYFSLIDTDPNTGMPILDMNTGKELFINNKFGYSNSYVNAVMDEVFVRDLYENLSIHDITTGSNLDRVYLKDKTTGITYELTVNDTEGFSLIATQSDLGTDEKYLRLITVDTNGNTVEKKYKIFVENKKLVTDTYYGDETTQDYFNINGTNAFYKLFINENETLDKSIIHFPRYDLYQTLINNKFNLNMGSDGENLIINNALNLYGPGDSTKQNAKQLLLDFYNNNGTIREVMYPKYDFDYIPDWTEDFDIMTAISNLGDELGFTMPIVSFPAAINADEDYRRRTEEFFINSYSTILYSGQKNLEHYDENTGGTIAIPHSYMAMLINLTVDRDYSITEPPANKNKGIIPDAKVKLAYECTSRDIEKLRQVQINTIISEVDGIYEIDQITAYKKSSKLSKINVVKPIHRMRKDIPRLLKDFIQLKAIDNNTTEIEKIVTRYMDRYKVSNDNQKDGIFKTIKIVAYPIEEEDKIIVSIIVNPVGTIEQINVPITVI